MFIGAVFVLALVGLAAYSQRGKGEPQYVDRSKMNLNHFL